jgi:hypothetical protein
MEESQVWPFLLILQSACFRCYMVHKVISGWPDPWWSFIEPTAHSGSIRFYIGVRSHYLLQEKPFPFHSVCTTEGAKSSCRMSVLLRCEDRSPLTHMPPCYTVRAASEETAKCCYLLGTPSGLHHIQQILTGTCLARPSDVLYIWQSFQNSLNYGFDCLRTTSWCSVSVLLCWANTSTIPKSCISMHLVTQELYDPSSV